MTTQPYTQAHNFFSAVSGGVDPRTGLFMFNFPVNNFHGNNTLGPVFPLALSYCPLDSDNDYQLGIGMTLGVSCYNSNSRSLILSSGERFKIVEDDDEESQPIIRQQKIDSVHFNKKDDGYTITHKSGLIEVLEQKRSGIYLPVTIHSPMGYYVELNWEISPWHNRLLDISDSRGKTVCIFTYAAENVEITLWPDTAEEQIIELALKNDYLTTIRNTSVTPVLQWDLAWDNDTQIHEKNVLNQVISPTKLIQQVEYTNGLMKYSIDDVSGSYPAVTTYLQSTADSSHMEQIVQTFSYSTETNYLGYGESYSSFAEDDDNLYGILNPYDYSSVQTLKGDGKTIADRIIERHYNNYHLLVSEKHTQAGSSNVVLSETEYYAVIGEEFDDQPNTFQLPKQQSSSWTNAAGTSRTETTRFTYDDFGNITNKVASDGTETRYTWFPATGVENLCPAEPNGFTRFMRQQQVTPPADKYHDTPVLKTDYQYLRLDSWNNTAPGYAVLQSQVTHSADNLVLSVEKFTYATAAALETGRMKSQVVDVHGSDGKVYTHSKAFTFSADYTAGTLAQQVQIDTHDKLSLIHKRVQSVHSGQLLSTTDAAGNTIKLEYDPAGRLISQIHHPDLPAYTARESWQYLLNPCAEGLPQVVHTDTLGNQKRTTSDPLGRKLIDELFDRDNSLGWTPFQQHNYDIQGRCFQSLYADTLPSHDDEEDDAAMITQTITRSWDDWGQLAAEASKDENIAGHHVTDPVLLTATHWTTGDNKAQSTKQVTYHDATSKLPIRADLLTLEEQVYNSTYQDWDAGRRLRQHTDENGRVTRYDYDIYGRVIKTTLPDGSMIEKQYVPFSSSALPVLISITAPGDKEATTLGTQKFDGLGRLLETQNGGRKYRYVYVNDWQQHPSSVTAPDGAVQNFTSDPALGEAPTRIFANHNTCSGSVTQTFSYNTNTGQLNSSSEGSNTESQWSYFPSGRVEEKTIDILGGGDKSSSFKYSLLGSLQSSEDIGGEQQLRHYSPQGYLSSITTDQLTIVLQYDDLKRLSSWIATDLISNDTVTTSVTRDEQGRESQRSMKYSSGEVRTIKQFWGINHQLSARQHELGIHTELAEYFTYDNRNRLVVFRCEGTRLPQLESGETFTQQTFSFDALSNIVSCVTKLTSGDLHTTTYLFENPDDPCQLTGLQTTVGSADPTVIKLKYDACGRMTQDQAKRILSYDALGRLQGIEGASDYSYDAHNTLVSQKITASGENHRLYYQASQLVNEWITAGDGQQDAAKDKNISLRYAAGGNVAEVHHDKGDTEVNMITTDAKQSVVTVNDDRVITYSAYGVSDNGNQLEDDADKVTSIAEFHFEYRDDSARSAVIYSNGWNQAPVQVRLLLWDKDNKPVKLSQQQLLQDNRLKFFLHDGTQLAMKPISDGNSGLTYWNVAGDYDKVVEYKGSVQFTKPITRSIATFNTVELEVDAWSPTAKPIKKLVVSYVIDGKETLIASESYNAARVNWKANWCLPAGEVTLKATTTDSEDQSIVTTHLLTIPAPKDKSWVIINTPSNNAEFTAAEKVAVNVSFQAKEGKKLTGVALSFDGDTIENINVDQSFINKNYTITMPDYTAQLTAALWSNENGEEQRHNIYLSALQESRQVNSSSGQDDTESTAVIYFATAETGNMYQIYAQLDLPHVSETSKDHEELTIETLQAINYSNTSNWEMTTIPAADKQYFDGYPNRKQCYIFYQEFRFIYTSTPQALVSVKNTGTTYSGGSMGEWSNFPLFKPVSALLGQKGTDYNINFWTVVPKPYSDPWQMGLAFDTRWNLHEYVYQGVTFEYEMDATYNFTDKTIPPYQYFSIYRMQICSPELGSDFDQMDWNNINNNSVVEVIDVYGNHGTITIKYKADSFIPLFP